MSLSPLIIKYIINLIWKTDYNKCLYLSQVSHYFLKVIQSHFREFRFQSKNWDISHFTDYVLERKYLSSTSLLANIDLISCFYEKYFKTLSYILKSKQWAEWHAIKNKDVSIEFITPEQISKYFFNNKYITHLEICNYKETLRSFTLPPNLKSLDLFTHESHHTFEGHTNLMELLNQLSDSVAIKNGTEHVMIERLSITSPFISELLTERSTLFFNLLNGSRFAYLKTLSLQQECFTDYIDDEEVIQDQYRDLYKIPKEFILRFIEYLRMNQKKEKRLKKIEFVMKSLLEKESQELLNQYLLSSECHLESIHIDMYIDTIPIVTNSNLKSLDVDLLFPEQASKGTNKTTPPLSTPDLISLGKLQIPQIGNNFKNIPRCYIQSCQPKLPNELKSLLVKVDSKWSTSYQINNVRFLKSFSKNTNNY